MITIKQGDTRHAIKATLKNSLGNAVDLTNASVVFSMSGRNVKVERAAIINEALTGSVWFVFQSGETDTVGVYRAEFTVTYPDSRVETFPNSNYLTVNIERGV